MEDAVGVSDQCVEVTRLEIELEHVEVSSILALPIRIVVVRERIDRSDIIPSRTQGLGQVRPDEAGCAGDEASNGQRQRTRPSAKAVRLPFGAGRLTQPKSQTRASVLET